MSEQKNIDELLGINLPRAGYAIAGSDWALEQGVDAPMIINLNTPGTLETKWSDTYGASLDSFLSIVDGFKIVNAMSTITVQGIYASAFPNTNTDNIWAPVEPSPELVPVPKKQQQVQYVVSGDDIETARTRIGTFGELFNIRGLCMRTPMMAQGYGRTKDMLPLFPSADDARKNEEDAKLDRAQWKVGTVDLRWDERRNVWGAWNDIIVDHESKGLGTTVFSTNPDAGEGFPWLKGKLEDVWWVRQPTALNGTNGKLEGQKTAEIMTHLEHSFFDEETDGSAKLKTVFVIPHKEASEEDDSCHKKGEENILGGETTGDSIGIDIRSTVHFWKENEIDGPIKFGRSLSDLGDEICCDSSSLKTKPKLFIGEMVFMDEELPTCDDDPGEIGEAEEKPPCEWVPAVAIDECSLIAGACETLVTNDINTIMRLDGLCTEISSYSEDLKGRQDGNNAALVGGIGGAVGAASKLAVSINAAFAGLTASINAALVAIAVTHGTDLIILVQQINAALAACECETSIDGIGGESSIPTISPPAVPKPTGSTITVQKLNEFDCDQCVPVKIKAPCSNAPDTELNIGVGCGGGNNSEPDYEDTGPCAANEE